jgi:hypothetical protein
MTVEIGSISDRYSSFESLGHPVSYVRIFVSNTALPPNSPWSLFSSLAAAGRWCHISWKAQTSWAGVASGVEDARFTTIGNYLAGIPAHTPHPHLITFHHEPEDDGVTGIDAQDGAQFQAAFNRAYSIIKPLAPQHLFCMIYMMGTVQAGDHGGAALWWPSSSEVHGQDYYFRRSSGVTYADNNSVSADLPPENFYQTHSGRLGAYQLATSHGVPIICPEFGINVKNPATGGGLVAVQQDRAALIAERVTKWGANCPNLWGVNYYDRGTPDGFRPYAIAGGSPEPACTDQYSLAAFDGFKQIASGQPPLVSSFTPTSGIVGTSVTVTGLNFTGATSVRFNGVIAAYTVVSPTTITATVPTGATTGPIRVQSVAGFDDSNPFTVGSVGTFLGSVSPATRVKAAS